MSKGNGHGRNGDLLTVTEYDAWVIQARKFQDIPVVAGEFLDLSPPIRRLLEAFPGRALEARAQMLEGIYPLLDEPGRQRLLSADPDAGPPASGPATTPFPSRAPSVDDLADPPAGFFLWTNRLVRAHLNAIASNPKFGKTLMFVELAKRLWYGTPFFGEEEPALPAGTTSLWVCGDGQQDELKQRAREYGFPGKALLLCALPENLYKRPLLEDDALIRLLAHYADVERPGLIFIDTIWRATNKQMKVEEDVNALCGPLLEIAQQSGSTIFIASHISKDGDTLGRRLEGAARSVMKLTWPDKEQKNRRRLNTIGNFKEPPDLGLTLRPDGVGFDLDPPKAPDPRQKWDAPESESGPWSESEGSRRRRKPESTRAREFLIDSLEAGPQVFTDLTRRWLATNGAKTTLASAKDDLVEEQILGTTPGPGKTETLTLIALPLPTTHLRAPAPIDRADWKRMLPSDEEIMDELSDPS
jgi:hypothetical protein